MVTQEKITTLYEHLSRDDVVDGDSNSIVNQKMFLNRTQGNTENI